MQSYQWRHTAAQPSSAAAKAKAPISPSPYPKTKKKIKTMLVDDDARNAILPKKFLQVESHEITYADNGPTAWKLHPSKCSDLMPLDVNMPDMNGFEPARLIRRQDHHMRIILLTDRTEITDRLTGIHPKGNDYIPQAVLSRRTYQHPSARQTETTRMFAENIGRVVQQHPSARQTETPRILAENIRRVVEQHPSARQTETLRMLAENIGRVVERDAILEAVWATPVMPTRWLSTCQSPICTVCSRPTSPSRPLRSRSAGTS